MFFNIIRAGPKIAITILLFGNVAVSAQRLDIAAIVNGSAITRFDVEQRTMLIFQNSGLKNTPGSRQRVYGQVLDQLIEEALKKQEADALSLLPPRAEAEAAYGRIAQANSLTSEQLDEHMLKIGTNATTLIDQLHANLAWQRVVRAKIAQSVRVAESEVNLVSSRIREESEQLQLNLGEIFLAVSDPRRKLEKQKLIEELKSQLEDGGRFSALAEQFSQSSSALKSGSIGWRVMGELEPVIADAVRDLPPGEISNIIETTRGFYIYTVLERRSAVDRKNATELKLSQIVFPVDMADKASMDRVREQIMAKVESINGCEAFNAVAKEVATPGSGEIGAVKYGSLNESYKNVLRDWPINTPTKPIDIPLGAAVLMICEKLEPKIHLPTEDEIRQQIRNERLTVSARRYLRDLSQEASIEIR